MNISRLQYMHEISRTHPFVSRRASNIGFLGSREKLSISPCPARSNHSYGRRRCLKSGYSQGASSVSSDCPALAPAFLVSTLTGGREGRSASRPKSAHYPAKNKRCYRGDFAHSAAECHSLEQPQHGQSHRLEPISDNAYLETIQSQTALSRDVQAQPRQALYQKIARYCRPVFKPSGQGPGSLCRREESDSSSRSNPAYVAFASGNTSSSNVRLHAARHNNVIRRFEYARRQSHRRLHAPASTSRIYPVLTAYQCQDPAGPGPAPYRRQLWYSQASTSFKMARAASSVPSSLHSDVQFMAQYGGALVQGDYRQAYSPRFIQKRSGPDRSHYTIPRESQPESARFYLERVCGNNHGKDRQM